MAIANQDFPEEDLNRHYQQEHPDRMMKWVRISRVLSQNGFSSLYHCAMCRSTSDSVDAVLRHAGRYHEESQGHYTQNTNRRKKQQGDYVQEEQKKDPVLEKQIELFFPEKEKGPRTTAA